MKLNKQKMEKLTSINARAITLDQMKLYELATGETMLGEISKKQKDIFFAFKISKSIKPSKKI